MVAISFSRDLSQGLKPAVSPCRQILYYWATSVTHRWPQVTSNQLRKCISLLQAKSIEALIAAEEGRASMVGFSEAGVGFISVTLSWEYIETEKEPGFCLLGALHRVNTSGPFAVMEFSGPRNEHPYVGPCCWWNTTVPL